MYVRVGQLERVGRPGEDDDSVTSRGFGHLANAHHIGEYDILPAEVGGCI
jgi:hypothetical protein